MSDPNSIINIGDLAKPATTLIEKISDATGVIFAPYQLKRMAKAEVEANKIKALGEIEVSEIQRRAMARLLAEETKKQENIEDITAKALPEIKEDAKPEEIENDWLANFFDKCKLVSDEEMQSLWSSILAGEANKPRSFSKRTIEIVSTLEKAEAELFTNLCSFNWNLMQPTPLIIDLDDRVYQSRGINFESINHLQAIGLVETQPIGFRLNGLLKLFTFSYYDEYITLEFSNDKHNELDLGRVGLTRSGRELKSICRAEKDEAFFNFIVKRWRMMGYGVWKASEKIISTYVSLSLRLPEGKEIKNMPEVSEKICLTAKKMFEIRDIEIKELEKSIIQFTFFLSNPASENDFLKAQDVFRSFNDLEINLYGWA